MNKVFMPIILSGIAGLTLAACENEYGTGIGRAQRDVALDDPASCSHYLAAIRPSTASEPGQVTLAAIADSAAGDNVYTLCSYGQCGEVLLSGEEVTVTLPLSAFDLGVAGEVALVIDGAYNVPSKICSYLTWHSTTEDGTTDNSDSQSEIQEDGSSDNISDSYSDSDDSAREAELALDGSSDSNSDGASDNDILTSYTAAVISGHWQLGESFPYNNQSCTMRAKVAQPKAVADWECK